MSTICQTNRPVRYEVWPGRALEEFLGGCWGDEDLPRNAGDEPDLTLASTRPRCPPQCPHLFLDQNIPDISPVKVPGMRQKTDLAAINSWSGPGSGQSQTFSMGKKVE